MNEKRVTELSDEWEMSEIIESLPRDSRKVKARSTRGEWEINEKRVGDRWEMSKIWMRHEWVQNNERHARWMRDEWEMNEKEARDGREMSERRLRDEWDVIEKRLRDEGEIIGGWMKHEWGMGERWGSDFWKVIEGLMRDLRKEWETKSKCQVAFHASLSLFL